MDTSCCRHVGSLWLFLVFLFYDYVVLYYTSPYVLLFKVFQPLLTFCFCSFFQWQVIMATNRADTLDPALLRPGRLDRKIEFPLPDRRQKRLVFSSITSNMNLSEEVDLEDCILNIHSFFFSLLLIQSVCVYIYIFFTYLQGILQ